MPFGAAARLGLVLFFGVSLAPAGAFREAFLHDYGDDRGGLIPNGRQAGQSLEEGSSSSSIASSEPTAELTWQVLTLGTQVIRLGIASFERPNFDLAASLKVLDEDLWDVVELTAAYPHDGSSVQSIVSFDEAKVKWDRAFSWIPGITNDIMAYRDSGDVDRLRPVMKSIFDTAVQSLANSLPPHAIYLEALGEFLDGIFNSFGMYTQQGTFEAVVEVWSSVEKAVKKIVPAYDGPVMNSDHQIDSAISRLVEQVFKYKTRLLTSQVCYKQTKNRKNERPSVCMQGFEWDQEHTCRPTTGANCWHSCGGEAGMCESFCGKGKACCQRGATHDPPECAGALGYGDTDFYKAEHYQCVTAGPRLQLEVKGGGDTRVNGLWVKSDMHSGKPRYRHAKDKHTIMEWSDSRHAWRLYIDKTTFGVKRATLYQSEEDSHFVPLTGWSLGSGLAPVPNITEYIPPWATWDPGFDFDMHDASCDLNSDYPEKDGIWCCERCPVGYLPSAIGSASTCERVCSGEFPVEGSFGGVGVCGRTAEEFARAKMYLLHLATLEAVPVKDVELRVAQLNKDVNAEYLSGTVKTFVGLGASFEKRTC